jgi:HEAT repeat protein
VTEENLADLQSENNVLKEAAIKKMGKCRSFPLSVISRVLGNTKEKQAVAILVDLLRRGKEPKYMELSLLKALGELGKRIEVPADVLIGRLKHQDVSIRSQAIEALGKIKERSAMPALLQLLREEKEPYPVIWCLGEIGASEPIASLNVLLASENKYTRFNAYRALKKIGKGQAEEDSVPAGPDSETSGLLDVASLAFKKYQEAMSLIFRKIRGTHTL